MACRIAGSARLLAALVLLVTPCLALGQEDEGAPLARKKGGFWERLRLGASINNYSPLSEIKSDSANFVTFRDIIINSTDIVFEPRVENGQVSISPLRTGGDLNFSVNADFIRDPRRDSGALQTNSLQSSLWLGLNAAYDIKSWRRGTLFVQLDAGYYTGDAGALEVAIDIAEQAILNPEEQDLTADDPLANYQFLYPTVGTVTQTPVSLSALWQFRPRSPFRPYVGLGYGYINASLDGSGELAKVNQQLAGIPYIWSVNRQVVSEGVLPAETITASVQSGTMFLAQGGLEYNINRNWSMYLSGQFVSTPARLQIRSLDEYTKFGVGITKSDAVDDAEGLGSEELFLRALLSLPVEDAVRLVDDIDERSADPTQNERTFFNSFPVALGTEVVIIVPNPVNPNEPTSQVRRTKMFVQGGDIEFDSFSLGIGFRYRY